MWLGLVNQLTVDIWPVSCCSLHCIVYLLTVCPETKDIHVHTYYMYGKNQTETGILGITKIMQLNTYKLGKNRLLA